MDELLVQYCLNPKSEELLLEIEDDNLNKYTVTPCKDDLYVLSCLVGTAHKYWEEFNRRRKLAYLYKKEAELKIFVHAARHKTYTTEEDKQYGRDLDKISEEIYKLEQETSWRRKNTEYSDHLKPLY